MILSDVSIRDALDSGSISIDPRPNEDQYDTSSLDLRLGGRFSRYKRELVDQPGLHIILDPESFDYPSISRACTEPIHSSEQDGSIVIAPSEFVLAVTRETIHLPEASRIAARIEGRSTLARIGLSVHLTAPTIQLGFQGRLALEIKNQGQLPIKLTPGMAICQLIFERVDEKPSGEIGTSFQGQDAP